MSHTDCLRDQVGRHSRIDDFILLRTVCRGPLVTVKLAREERNVNRTMLLKLITESRDSQQLLEKLLARATVNQRLQHLHIVETLKISSQASLNSKKGTVSEVAYVANELCAGGRLFDFLALSGGLTEVQLRTVFVALLRAMLYAQKEGVAHGALKPENLLFASDFTIKISDFGWDPHIPVTKPASSNLSYIAPEAVAGKDYDPYLADIFSLGVILYNLLFAARPFTSASTSDEQYRLFRNNKVIFWQQRKGRFLVPTQELTSLIDQMLEENPRNRPNLQQLCEHEWVCSSLLRPDVFSDYIKQLFWDMNRELQRKRMEQKKRKRVQGAGTTFKGEDDFEEEQKKLTSFEPHCEGYFRLFLLFTADQVAYILRNLLRCRSGYIFMEDSHKYRYRVTYTGNGSPETRIRMDLHDADGALVLELIMESGCFFSFWIFFVLLKTEMDYSESLFSL